MKPTDNQVPRHIGIIMDGNRRFARRLMMKPWKGHEWGARKIENLLEWCKEFDIRELTLYTFSLQNFSRPKQEYDYIMEQFNESYERLKNDDRLHKYKIRVNVIGRLWMFPKEFQDKAYEIMEKTKRHNKYVLNLAIAYGGREEVVDAAKKVAEQIKNGKIDIEQINEETFSKCLYIPDEPDLIIRTGGEQRLSNFLSFQSAYTELIFLKKMWPEFEKEDFVKCLNEFSKRKRRFGR
ncbi:di-trans,poly-cis-decaprenylcistransferase [Candidatus Woesearchaeota archaeon]|nr:di-trans,poly-cis-decaprenylcistransferase [Candidatus Woesearchaeota archaeon]